MLGFSVQSSNGTLLVKALEVAFETPVVDQSLLVKVLEVTFETPVVDQLLLVSVP